MEGCQFVLTVLHSTQISDNHPSNILQIQQLLVHFGMILQASDENALAAAVFEVYKYISSNFIRKSSNSLAARTHVFKSRFI